MSKNVKPRNGHAWHPIMRKGGVHQSSKSGERQAAKQHTQKMARQWHDPAGSDHALAA